MNITVLLPLIAGSDVPIMLIALIDTYTVCPHYKLNGDYISVVNGTEQVRLEIIDWLSPLQLTKS